jgi:hypothetical protein
MHQHYCNITDRLGAPEWWDECGVPRYCSFSPAHVNDVYATQVALLEIACQNCGWRFIVALSWHARSARPGQRSLAERIADDTIHYGDPPNVGCCLAGPTMNSIPLRVLEFWVRTDALLTMQRQPAYERAIHPDWMANEEYPSGLPLDEI